MIDQICTSSDFNRKHAAGRQIRQNAIQLDPLPTQFNGIGLATSFQGNEFLTRDRTLTASSVSATLNKEGELVITLNAVPATPSLMAVWKKRISAQLSIPEEQIHFVMDYPDEQQFTGPSVLSRSSTILTRLIDQSCDLIQKKRFREALPITETGTFRRRTKADWDEKSLTGNPFANPSWAVAVVEVRLETATMELQVPRIWLTIHCGPLLDKTSARSYLEAEVRLALCQCLKKQAIRPTIFPELKIDFIETESKVFKPGGIEGLILAAVPPAFAQAVSLASGLSIRSLPLDSGDLLYREKQDAG
jgi:CO/xanthine dehydrogenase Mo-binding subunit